MLDAYPYSPEDASELETLLRCGLACDYPHADPLSPSPSPYDACDTYASRSNASTSASSQSIDQHHAHAHRQPQSAPMPTIYHYPQSESEPDHALEEPKVASPSPAPKQAFLDVLNYELSELSPGPDGFTHTHERADSSATSSPQSDQAQDFGLPPSSFVASHRQHSPPLHCQFASDVPGGVKDKEKTRRVRPRNARSTRVRPYPRKREKVFRCPVSCNASPSPVLCGVEIRLLTYALPALVPPVTWIHLSPISRYLPQTAGCSKVRPLLPRTVTVHVWHAVDCAVPDLTSAISPTSTPTGLSTTSRKGPARSKSKSKSNHIPSRRRARRNVYCHCDLLL